MLVTLVVPVSLSLALSPWWCPWGDSKWRERYFEKMPYFIGEFEDVVSTHPCPSGPASYYPLYPSSPSIHGLTAQGLPWQSARQLLTQLVEVLALFCGCGERDFQQFLAYWTCLLVWHLIYYTLIKYSSYSRILMARKLSIQSNKSARLGVVKYVALVVDVVHWRHFQLLNNAWRFIHAGIPLALFGFHSEWAILVFVCGQTVEFYLRQKRRYVTIPALLPFWLNFVRSEILLVGRASLKRYLQPFYFGFWYIQTLHSWRFHIMISVRCVSIKFYR